MLLKENAERIPGQFMLCLDIRFCKNLKKWIHRFHSEKRYRYSQVTYSREFDVDILDFFAVHNFLSFEVQNEASRLCVVYVGSMNMLLELLGCSDESLFDITVLRLH